VDNPAFDAGVLGWIFVVIATTLFVGIFRSKQKPKK